MSQLVQVKWDRKLTNWARWLVSGGDGGKGKSSLLDFGSTPHWSDVFAPMPPVGEALDTDDLLQKMAVGEQRDRDLYRAVKAWYTWAGSTRDWAIALGIHVDTLHDRVRAARYRLDDLDVLRRRRMATPPSGASAMLT
jgi:hypothetical protein